MLRRPRQGSDGPCTAAHSWLTHPAALPRALCSLEGGQAGTNHAHPLPPPCPGPTLPSTSCSSGVSTRLHSAVATGALQEGMGQAMGKTRSSTLPETYSRRLRRGGGGGRRGWSVGGWWGERVEGGLECQLAAGSPGHSQPGAVLPARHGKPAHCCARWGRLTTACRMSACSHLQQAGRQTGSSAGPSAC